MFKKRFTTWGLFKNRRRSAEPWGAERTPDAGYKVESHHVEHPQCPDVLCISPIGQHFGEVALCSIKDWTNGSLDGKHWLGTGAYVTHPSSRLQRDFALSYALFSRGEGALAGMAVRKAFWQLEDSLKIGDAAVMRNLVDIFLTMIERKQDVLIRILLRQLACLAARDLSIHHPLTRVFRDLARNHDHFESLLKETWRCFVDIMHRRMDLDHQWHYENWLWDSYLRVIDTDPDEDYRLMTQALQALAFGAMNVEGKVVPRSQMDVLKYTALMRKNNGSLETNSILKAMEDEYADRPVMGPETGMEGYMANYLKTAIIKRSLDQEHWSLAEEMILSKVRNMTMVYGEASREVIRELWSLEKVLKRAGQTEKAELIAEEARERGLRYLAEVPGYL
jgi:hypothetical protein